MLLKLVIFFAVFAPICCVKLSEEFDAERAEMCGLPNTPKKPSSNPPDDKAPWTMGIHFKKANATKQFNEVFVSGTLVSPRHVLAPAYAAVTAVINTTRNQWKWSDGSKVDFKKCQENEMEVPAKILKLIKVHISICQDQDQCGTHIIRSVVKGWYLGHCQPGEVPFGLLLLEISSNVPQDEPFFVPVCIPAEKKPVFVKDPVHFDSFNSHKGVTKIISEPATIRKCDAGIGTFVQSVCADLGTCPKGSEGRSGTLVKKIEGRETGIALLFYFEDGCKNHHYVSIGFFKDKLCSLAGICKVTTPPPEESSQCSIQYVFVFLFLVFFLCFSINL